MSASAARRKVLRRIADHLVAGEPGHPLRVAVDGITAAGKTTFADELGAHLAALGRPVVRLSMDGFHHPRAHRHRQGRASAVGYYEDAYDFAALAEFVLHPAGDGASEIRARIIDLNTDRAVDTETVKLVANSILVVDGSFLQKRELAGLWDTVVFLDVEFDAAFDRGTRRDTDAFGGLDAAAQAFEQRYHQASRLYLDEHGPQDRADIVVENSDLHEPALRRIGGDAAAAVQLFSYGTLQDPDVQQSSFGRLLSGAPDALPGHRTDWVPITDKEIIAVSGTDRHPIVRASGSPGDIVHGTVFTISTTELAAADEYEVNDYRRIWVQLASGTGAWTYVAPPVASALDRQRDHDVDRVHLSHRVEMALSETSDSSTPKTPATAESPRAPRAHRLRRWWIRARIPVPTLIPFGVLALLLWLDAAINPYRFNVALAVVASLPVSVLLIRGNAFARRAAQDESQSPG